MIGILFFIASVYAVSYPIPNLCTNCCNHWTYDEQDVWGSVICNTTKTSGVPITNYCQTGSHQSPVNIKGWQTDNTLPPLTFVDYGPNPSMTIVNNGHTIQASYTNGYYSNDKKGSWYQIAQFHFHTHSEETVKGVGDSASLHLVHAQNPPPTSTTQALSVLGILFVVGSSDNPLLTPIINALSIIPNLGNSTVINFGGFQSVFHDMNTAKTNQYWNYPGSLTTPPCTENIDWTVLAVPWSISQSQLDALNAVLVSDANSTTPGNSNNRKVQRILNTVAYFAGSGTTVVSASVVLFAIAFIAQFW